MLRIYSQMHHPCKRADQSTVQTIDSKATGPHSLVFGTYLHIVRENPMPSRTSQIAQIGKRQIELSNLQKVLYPNDHITKAHLIEYYVKLAPTFLAHVRGRPLSLVRYPDGIGGEAFYQKNRPEWAPAWIEHVVL